MNSFTQDIRFAIRSLWLRPGFTAVAALTLALGIGANTAIFSTSDAVLIRPMPYPDADRLVVLWESSDERGLPFMNVAPPNFHDWKARARSFERMAVWREQSFTVSLRQGAEQVHGAGLSHGMLDVLKVAPALGRGFTEAEDAHGGANVAVISERLWRMLFGGERAVLGKAIIVDGVAREIVGVMPASFKFPPPVAFEGVPAPKVNDLWIPLGLGQTTGQRGAHYLLAIARLRNGVTIDDAGRELAAIAGQIAREHPGSQSGWSARVVPFDRQVTGDQRPALVALTIAVALVLLLACANVASLLLARGVARQREMAIRGALGASRFRIARQLLTESLMLSAIGAIGGTVIASWLVRAVRGLGGPLLPRFDEVALDGRALAFTTIACLGAAVLFGMAPALELSRSGSAPRSGSADWLKDRGGSARGGRLQSALVVIELALSVVLLAGAALLGQSFFRLVTTDPGFRADRTLTAHFTLPRTRYPDRPSRAALLDRVLADLRSRPGVTAAGAIDAAPLADDRQGTGFTIEGAPPTPGGDASANFSFVTPGYFAALGIPIVRGRDFSDADRADTAPVIIINQEAARRYFGNRDPIGMRIRTGFNTQTPREIVGIVGNELHVSLDRPANPGVYTTFSQIGWGAQLTLVVRTSDGGEHAAAALRAAVRNVDTEIALYDVRSMEEIVSASVSRPRFAVILLGLFAGTALLLAAVGVYGVISQVVGQRTKEFGVRLALGAAPRDLAALVLSYGLRLAVLGVAFGLPAAFAFSRVLEGMLYGISATNLATYAAVALGLTLTAAAAAVVPARRATATDPMVALRVE